MLCHPGLDPGSSFSLHCDSEIPGQARDDKASGLVSIDATTGAFVSRISGCVKLIFVRPICGLPVTRYRCSSLRFVNDQFGLKNKISHPSHASSSNATRQILHFLVLI
jgi:hypothetical protein